MPRSNPRTAHDPSRTDSTRQRVLDAARRLLRKNGAEFSMRELAAEAGLSFATPFNQFGNKVAIMHALSAELISAMAGQFAQAKIQGDAAQRVLAAVDIATSVMLASPQVNRAVIGTLGAPSDNPGQVHSQSRRYWSEALGDGGGFQSTVGRIAEAALPDMLATAFRGGLSFWSAGELTDEELPQRARKAAATLLLGFVEADRRELLLAVLNA